MKQPTSCRLCGVGLVFEGTLNQNIINRIRHPVERHCHLEYAYILSSSLDDMVKIEVSRDHPERRLLGINQCYPDAVLVVYTVRIPYAYRVEQLAHAELALQHVVHAYGRCYTNHRGVVQGIA